MSLVHRLASREDSEAIVELANQSYSGEQAEQGWTNENGLVAWPRTTVEKMLALLATDSHVFLLFFEPLGRTPVGCIGIEHKVDSHVACLHMFAVRPDLQARGYGKSILSTAETYARDRWHVEAIEMGVIIQRTELVAFYTRRGYVDTGRRRTFTAAESNAGRTGPRTLELCIMIKHFNES